MENDVLTPQIKIEDKIIVIRGQHVMIDRDLGGTKRRTNSSRKIFKVAICDLRN